MTRKERLRLQLRHMRITLWDRLIDLGNLSFPIFVVSGVLVASFKFWLWIFA